MFAMTSGAKPSSAYDEFQMSGPRAPQAIRGCLASCDLEFYDSEAPQGSYDNSCQKAHAGNGLIIVAWNSKGYRLGEVLYRISTP